MSDSNADSSYYNLTPDTVLQAVEASGWLLDGTQLALNSYENRVYRVATEDGERLVVKFYRPGRWSDAQILEEHDFCAALAEAEIPVIAPLTFSDGSTLRHWQGFRLAAFPCVGGRQADLESLDNLEQLGRFLGRLHQVGRSQPFQHRPAVDLTSYGADSCATILASSQLPTVLKPAFEPLFQQIMAQLERVYAAYQCDWDGRIHADFHSGNILWSETGPFIVDFDDARTGPAIQDLWMLIGSDPDQQMQRLDALLAGYEEFADLPLAQLALIEPLRTLRMLHYCAWLCRRWSDPSFQMHFLWFAEHNYWEQFILQLKEQLALLQDDETLARLSPGNYY